MISYIDNIKAITNGHEYSIICPYDDGPQMLKSIDVAYDPSDLVLYTNGPVIKTTILDGWFFKSAFVDPIILLNSSDTRKDQWNDISYPDRAMNPKPYSEYVNKDGIQHIFINIGSTVLVPGNLPMNDKEDLVDYMQDDTICGYHLKAEEFIRRELLWNRQKGYNGQYPLWLSY